MDGVDNPNNGCAKDGGRVGATQAKLGGLAKKDMDMARSVFARFQEAKEKKVKSPYVPPPEENLFQYSGRTDRHLHQELVGSGALVQPDWGLKQRRKAEGQHQEQFGPPRRRRIGFQHTQPQTAQDYLLAARCTAEDKNLARVAEVEAQRLQDELHREKAVNTELESQLLYHEAAFQEFLQYHYRQVSDALTKGDTARRNFTEQEVRIDYFSGLLTEAQTVQEEEEERLQELTAFQQFLAAVTPSQSLKDLKRRMLEIEDEVKASYAVEEDSYDSDTIFCNPVDFAQAAGVVASENSEITTPIGEGSGGGTLGANLMSLRMMKPGNSHSRSPSGAGHRPSQPQSPEGNRDLMPISQNGTDTCDAGAFDEFLDDDGRLVALASMYESQCHALLALLTRLRDQTEAINKEVENRQKKLNGRLQEIQQLQEKAKGGGHEDQLRDLHTLIAEWPRLSGDAEAQNQLDQLVAQIAEVVSDVFGSSEYSPLVPQTQTDMNQKQIPKSITGSK
ncbi:uncharacterized protein [Panulirus ornatus]